MRLGIASAGALAFGVLSALACSEMEESFAPFTGEVRLPDGALQLTLGDTARVNVTVVDDAGVPVEQAVNWSSENSQVAVVDSSGQLIAVGTGSTTITAESRGAVATAEVSVDVRLVNVTTRFTHTCGVTDRGRVACWGGNGFGELGNGTLFGSGAPALVTGPNVFDTVVVGGAHSCALTAGDEPYCWGINSSGQLGVGTVDFDPHPHPLPVDGDLTLEVTRLGGRHTCGLTGDGELFCWGGSPFGQLGTGPANICPTSGNPCQLVPVLVDENLRFTRISTGGSHTCGIATTGTTYCWGQNILGQVGDGTDVDRDVPTPVAGDPTFEEIATGFTHTCALDPQGAAYCWGWNAGGRLGVDSVNTSLVPVPVQGGFTFAAITAGDGHTCALAADGTAYCWGGNTAGQLGDGTGQNSAAPVAVAGVSFRSITAGLQHTCGMSLDNVVYCWGANNSGELGVGGGPARTTPTRVLGQP